MSRRERVALEAEEQRELARVLDRSGIAWFHCPNGGSRHKVEAAHLRQQGVKRGVPDVVILSSAPGAPGGAVVELKRCAPVGSLRDVAPDQWVWLGRFAARGFAVVVGLGARDAVLRLRALGYPVQGEGGVHE